jgi:hypothetical protein
MAQAKHTFIESKMNKDLDDRLLSGGQYRDAINVAVSKSEDSDVGALENVLGNTKVSDFFPTNVTPPGGLEIIGWYINETNNLIYLFLTNYTDLNNPNSSIFSQEYSTTKTTSSAYNFDPACYINQYNIVTGAANILVEGAFLNFSTTYRITGVNLVENLLFWTDNRNQPRKINVITALNNTNANPRYYTNEDTISVAKYAPYSPMDVNKETKFSGAVTVTNIQTSPNASFEVQLYNDTTSSFSAEQLLNASTNSTQPMYSKVQVAGADFSNIPNFCWFGLTRQINNKDVVGELYQMYTKAVDTNGVTVNDTFYVWPNISGIQGDENGIVFYESNLIDTTSEYLPPSGRLKVTNPSTNALAKSAYSWFALGGTDPVPQLEWLSGGDPNKSTGAGLNNAVSNGLPLTYFAPIVNFPSFVTTNPQPTDFNRTRGIVVPGANTTDNWKPIKITSNTLNITNARAVFGVDITNTANKGIQTYFGIPAVNDTNDSTGTNIVEPGPGIWNFALDQAVTLSQGEHYFDFHFPNPYYQAKFPGDKSNLKDKFVRFAYRFKYDDGEYSLVSPFTQTCFVPEQDGYFIKEGPVYNAGKPSVLTDQLTQAGEDTIVEWFENKTTEVKLEIPLEYPVNEMQEKLKVVEVDILYKESDALALKLVETVDFTNSNSSIISNSTKIFTYTYQSAKPFKTLPDDVITRTSDKVPLRALTQESSGNRIIYGNFIDKHTSPISLNYKVGVSSKFQPNTAGQANDWIPYPNHTLKQNRTYQVGVVLTDRYGRQSDVILSPPQQETETIGTTTYGDSTIYSPYKNSDFINSDFLDWRGDSIKMLWNTGIPLSLNDREGYPGLYNGDITSPNYNPLGFYTYKIVVKQKQQDYYNVYLPSLLWGQPRKADVSIDWGDGITGGNAFAPGETVIDELVDTSGIEIGMTFTLNTIPGGTGSSQEFSVVKIISNSQVQVTPASQYTFKGNFAGVPTNQINNPIIFKYASSYGTGAYLPESMTTTLLTDNINKVPPDLTDVRPNQVMYRTSDLEIIPRIARSFVNELVVDYNSGASELKLNYASQIFPGFKTDVVSILGNWNDIIGEGDNTTTGLYEYDKNPVVSIFSNTFQIGSTTSERQYASVLETAPVVSELDIFWETSTSGLISDLNQLVDDGDSPVGLAIVSNFDQNESFDFATTPSQVLKVNFTNTQGGVISTLNSVSIFSVFDGNGLNKTSEYQMGTQTGNDYPVEATANIVFKNDQLSNNRIFTFLVNFGNPATTATFQTSTFSIANANPVLSQATGSIPFLPTIPAFVGIPDISLDIGPSTGSGSGGLYNNGSIHPIPLGTGNQYVVTATNGSAILTFPSEGDDQYDEVVSIEQIGN